MKLMEIKQVETILHNNVKISEFADLHNVSEEVAKKILERLLEKPETTAEFKKYIFSTEHSDNLKIISPLNLKKRIIPVLRKIRHQVFGRF